MEDVQIRECFASTWVEVQAVSKSILEDEEHHSRIFQAENHKYGDILSQDRLQLQQCSLELARELGTRLYEGIALQHEESNFAFIRRLAAEANTALWIKDWMEQPLLIVGNRLLPSQSSFAQRDIIYSTIRKSRSGGGRFITSRRLAYFGQGAQLEGEAGKYIITGWQMDYVNGNYEFTYELTEEKPDMFPRVPAEELCLELAARVKSQADPEHRGRLQVLFAAGDGLQDVEGEQPRWLPFLTTYTGREGGVVFLPDEDDAVNVVYSKGNCYITAAKRERELPEEIRQVKDKYIGNNFQQRIFWKEKSLELLSAENRIYMDKDRIELLVGKTRILMDRDQIQLMAGKARLILNQEGIAMEGAGAKERLSAQGVELTGSKLAAAAQGGVSISAQGSAVLKAGGRVDIGGTQINLAGD